MKEQWSHDLMVGWGMMLGEVVTFVGVPRLPVDEKLFLSNVILDPMELHVDGLGPPLFDLAIGKSYSSGVVNLNGSGWLWVAKVDECLSDGHSIFGIEVGPTNFCLHGRTHNMLDDFVEGVEGSIWGGLGLEGFRGVKGAITKEVVATSLASGSWLREVGGIAMDI